SATTAGAFSALTAEAFPFVVVTIFLTTALTTIFRLGHLDKTDLPQHDLDRSSNLARLYTEILVPPEDDDPIQKVVLLTGSYGAGKSYLLESIYRDFTRADSFANEFTNE